MHDPRVRLFDDADPSPALECLDQLAVKILVPEDLPQPAAAAAAALVAITCRLFAHVQIEGRAPLPLNPWGASNVIEVLEKSTAVRPAPATAPQRTMRVAVGDSTTEADLFLGGGAFTVRLGSRPQPIDLSEIRAHGHAMGIHAGAALAAAELAKLALSPLGRAFLGVGDSFVWNLVDYRQTAAPVRGTPAAGPLDLALAACGSVGSSAAAILGMSPGISGSAVCIDTDSFDPTRNPFRYPALTGNEDDSKANWAADWLIETGWNAEPAVCGVAEWNVRRGEPGFPGFLISSVDTREARFDIADVLARTTCSIGVAGLALHAQIERLGDGFACPFCDFVTLAPPLNQAQAIMEVVGLPIERVIQLIQGAPIAEGDLQQMVAAGRISPDSVAMPPRRLEDVIARAYAEVSVPAAPAAKQTIAVAAPHVSWLAGALGAAEAAKEAGGLAALDRRVDIDLSGLPLGYTSKNPAVRENCACSTGHRKKWMDRLWAK